MLSLADTVNLTAVGMAFWERLGASWRRLGTAQWEVQHNFCFESLEGEKGASGLQVASIIIMKTCKVTDNVQG